MSLCLADNALEPCVTEKDEGNRGRDGEPGSPIWPAKYWPSGSSRLAGDDLALQTKLFLAFKLAYFNLMTNDQCLTCCGSHFTP